MTTDDTSKEAGPTNIAAPGTSARRAAAPNTSPKKLRRTWPQRFTIGGVYLAAVGCFAAGSGLYAAQRVIEDRDIVAIESGAPGENADDATFSASTPRDPATSGDIAQGADSLDQRACEEH